MILTVSQNLKPFLLRLVHNLPTTWYFYVVFFHNIDETAVIIPVLQNHVWVREIHGKVVVDFNVEQDQRKSN